MRAGANEGRGEGGQGRRRAGAKEGRGEGEGE
jgi:hypothetical protein